MEVDYIFICVNRGVPEAELLKQFGLAEGSSNTHTGQGTANRRFFFQSFFIELLWLESPAEARSEQTAPTMLYERLKPADRSVSPFGICFRPDASGNMNIPFSHWIYQPDYLPDHLSIVVARTESIQEPMWFYRPFASRPNRAIAEMCQPLRHDIGFAEVTSIKLSMPNLSVQPVAGSLREETAIQIEEGEAHLIELSFDHEQQGCVRDFRPDLALIFRW